MKKNIGRMFSVGAVAYPLLEIVFRGRSHWSMALAGGVCLCLLDAVERRLPRWHWCKKCLLGAGLITAVEFVCGCLCNRLWKMKVWDYSAMPCNILGQICLPFTMLWFALCMPVFAFLRRVYRH